MSEITHDEESMESIIFVDNEPDIIDTFCFLLKRIFPDFEVRVALDGQSAMDMIQEESPRLVLSDYSMGKVSGGDIAAFCMERSIPCAIISGHPSEDLVGKLPEGVAILQKTDLLMRGRLEEFLKDMLQEVA